MSDWILKNRFIVFFSFCLYIIFSVYYYNIFGFTLLGPKYHEAYAEVNTFSLLACFLLMLASTMVNRKLVTPSEEKRSDNHFPFVFETVISGYFLAIGSYFCLNGMTVEKVAVVLNPEGFNWSKICILVLLMLSLLVFYFFFHFAKEKLFSFLGYVLVLMGLLSLYYAGYDPLKGDMFLQLFSISGTSATDPVTNIIIAGICWLISLKVNQSISNKYRPELLWTETLFFSFIISAIGVLYLSVLFKNRDIWDISYYSVFHYESIFMYACFLFFCLQCYLMILRHKHLLAAVDAMLNSWVAVILFLNIAFCLCFHKDYPFMIKTTLLCLGTFIIWKPLVYFESTKSENSILKTGILLFLGCVLSCGIIIVIFQLFFNSQGLWLPNTLSWYFILFKIRFQEHEYIFIFLLSVMITAILMKRYSFEKTINVMCRGIILCLMAWLTVGLVQEFVTSLFHIPISMIKFEWWESADKKTQDIWLMMSLIVSSVLSLIFAVMQCKKGIGRIIIWTVLCNMILYKGIGISIGMGFLQILALIRYPEGLGIGDRVTILYCISIVPYFIMFALLGLSFVIIYFTRAERSILPKLMNCRMPNSEEKEKLDKISSVIYEKTGIPFSSYRILICLKSDNNPFSMGRNTVVITKSLLDHFSIDEIGGLVAHELGHIKQKDGHYSFIIDALNIPVFMFSKISSGLLTGKKIIAVFTLTVFFIMIYSALSDIIKYGMSRIIFYVLLQTAIIIIRKQDFRESEFTADSFASEHGLGQELKTALLQIGGQKESLSLWELIMSDYPDFPERIKRLDAVA